MFALADCNNFYASCERVFRPDLQGKPVIVLSNNDGCAVARSNEAKALGIKMGDPLFKIRDIVEKHNVAVFSGNMALYGDMSQRVRWVLEEYAPSVEVYSIDEAFLDLRGMEGIDFDAYAKKISSECWRLTSIPVSVGIAPTKPDNVYIIGTMNDIDRSVESMDFAFRRRFAFIEIKAEDRLSMLDELKDKSLKTIATNRLKNINKAISEIECLSPAYHIGASYFLKLNNYEGNFELLWEYHIEGLLREYMRGMRNVDDKIKELKKAYDNESAPNN